MLWIVNNHNVFIIIQGYHLYHVHSKNSTTYIIHVKFLAAWHICVQFQKFHWMIFFPFKILNKVFNTQKHTDNLSDFILGNTMICFFVVGSIFTCVLYMKIQNSKELGSDLIVWLTQKDYFTTMKQIVSGIHVFSITDFIEIIHLSDTKILSKYPKFYFLVPGIFSGCFTNKRALKAFWKH